MGLLDRALNIGEGKQFRQYEKRVAAIGALEDELTPLSDEELRGRMDGLRERVREQGEHLDDVLPECFAIVREAGRRTMGMRHFDVQLIGGMVLHGGNIAEMKTGEGKTLTGTLAVCLNALAGHGVHVVTVNDYLARRDAEWMSPIYDVLGFSWGVLQNMQDPDDKIAAYAADITYGTNSEFGFDYLRDNMAQSLEEKVQHGGRIGPDGEPPVMHFFAIVDEVDNILIDEARTPLIISGHADSTRDDEAFDIALDHARGLRAGVHYHVFASEHRLGLLPRGRQTSDELEALGPPWDQSSEREHLVTMALTALHVLQPDEHYLVRDGKVEIIDEFTGRILPDRTWVEGLHEMVERKEMLELSRRRATQARMTYQRFFRRYRRLAGMTGTAQEVAAELWRVYRLPVASIPLNRPDRKIAALTRGSWLRDPAPTGLDRADPGSREARSPCQLACHGRRPVRRVWRRAGIRPGPGGAPRPPRGTGLPPSCRP